MKEETVRLSDDDIVFLQKKYSALSYDEERNIIRGKLKFDTQYRELEAIVDEYQIEINLNKVMFGVPVVKEIGDRILNIAKQKNLDSADLHINDSEEMCIIIPPEAKERYPNGFDLKELLKHLEEHLYWVSYFEKYNKEPWKAYGHGDKGYFELFRKDKIKYRQDFKNYFKCITRQEVRKKYRELEKKYKK